MVAHLLEMRYSKGFRIINVPIGVNDFGYHTLYLKEHADRSKESTGKVLFVGNVEYNFKMNNDLIDRFLSTLLSRFGDIEGISINAPSDDVTAKFAHVEFKSKQSLKNALSCSDADYDDSCREVAEKFGSKDLFTRKSIADLKRMLHVVDKSPTDLKAEVDEYMKGFEEEEEQARIEREKRLNEVDEDGFQQVKPRNKRKSTDDAGTGGNEQKRSRNNKKKETELKNFYRFQIKEEKMNKLNELRKKFEEDKERVTKMKEARKFKPF